MSIYTYSSKKLKFVNILISIFGIQFYQLQVMNENEKQKILEQKELIIRDRKHTGWDTKCKGRYKNKLDIEL